jgi:hypothetical protein
MASAGSMARVWTTPTRDGWTINPARDAGVAPPVPDTRPRIPATELWAGDTIYHPDLYYITSNATLTADGRVRVNTLDRYNIPDTLYLPPTEEFPLA